MASTQLSGRRIPRKNPRKGRMDRCAHRHPQSQGMRRYLKSRARMLKTVLALGWMWVPGYGYLKPAKHGRRVGSAPRPTLPRVMGRAR